jgi:hypothetical protein
MTQNPGKKRRQVTSFFSNSFFLFHWETQHFVTRPYSQSKTCPSSTSHSTSHSADRNLSTDREVRAVSKDDVIINRKSNLHRICVIKRYTQFTQCTTPPGTRHFTGSTRTRFFNHIDRDRYLCTCTIPKSAGGMDVCCERCMLSVRGLCDGLTARPEISYRVWCVWVWSRSLHNAEA